MKNKTSFQDYTLGDFVRAGFVAAVWVILYVFLAAYSGGRPEQTAGSAAPKAPVSVAGAGPSSPAASGGF